VADTFNSPRLDLAVRDLAVFTASTARRAWTVNWERVADLVVVKIDFESSGDEAATVEWSVPTEGVSGSFDTGASAVVGDLALRIGDLAAELWRS
jgi:hypothetical protein